MNVSETPNTATPSSSNASTQMAPPRARRLACALYEGVLLFGVVFVAGYFFDTLTQSRHALYLRHARQAWLFLVLGAYFVWFWSKSGQTLAMKTWHVRVVNTQGLPPPLWQAAVRYALCWPALLIGLELAPTHKALAVLAVCVPMLWTFFDKEKQYPQDRLSGTRLITHRPR